MKYTKAGEPVWVALAIPETAIVTYRCRRADRAIIRARIHKAYEFGGIRAVRTYLRGEDMMGFKCGDNR